MKPKIILLATIDGIKAEGDYDKSDQIYPFDCFSNDPDVVVEQIADSTKSFRQQFGESSFRSILQSKATVFSQIGFEDLRIMGMFLKKHPPNDLMNAFDSRLNTFVLFLWIVKDSGASVGNIYCILDNQAAVAKIPNAYFSSCKGDVPHIIFQRDEIKSAIKILDGCRISAKKQKHPTPSGLGIEAFPSVFSADQSRLSKALLMLQVVRQSEDIALKIAHYCACFEILFNSPSGTEGIAHQLAERIAFFLSTSANERVAIYDNVRNAYRIRCEIFHGTFLKPKRQQSVEQTCVTCDDLLRKILHRILTSSEFADLFTDKPDSFDKYFKDLIFGIYKT